MLRFGSGIVGFYCCFVKIIFLVEMLRGNFVFYFLDCISVVIWGLVFNVCFSFEFFSLWVFIRRRLGRVFDGFRFFNIFCRFFRWVLVGVF